MNTGFRAHRVQNVFAPRGSHAARPVQGQRALDAGLPRPRLFSGASAASGGCVRTSPHVPDTPPSLRPGCPAVAPLRGRLLFSRLQGRTWSPQGARPAVAPGRPVVSVLRLRRGHAAGHVHHALWPRACWRLGPDRLHPESRVQWALPSPRRGQVCVPAPRRERAKPSCGWCLRRASESRKTVVASCAKHGGGRRGRTRRGGHTCGGDTRGGDTRGRRHAERDRHAAADGHAEGDTRADGDSRGARPLSGPARGALGPRTRWPAPRRCAQVPWGASAVRVLTRPRSWRHRGACVLPPVGPGLVARPRPAVLLFFSCAPGAALRSEPRTTRRPGPGTAGCRIQPRKTSARASSAPNGSVTPAKQTHWLGPAGSAANGAPADSGTSRGRGRTACAGAS